LKNELNYYEQTIFLYATGYFDFKKNPYDFNGIEKMKKAIQVFDILDETKIKSSYLEHFKRNIK
ncbi:Rgg/GadR/MutR family transcriptional regulator, partial [Streptococcus sp. OH4692_COT-348]